MNAESANGRRTTTAPHQAALLLPTTEAQVRELAKGQGNAAAMAEEVGRSARGAEMQRDRSVAQSQYEAWTRRRDEATQHLWRSRRRLSYTEPETIVRGQRAPIGIAGFLVVAMVGVGLVIILWLENGAAAQTLLSTGAFDVTKLSEARVVMLTPIAVGIAFILGFPRLPPFVRKVAYAAACAALVVVFLGWAVSFAVQAHQYRADALETITLQEQGWEDASLGEVDGGHAGEGWSAWLMFGCLGVMMPLTTFIGHSGLEHYLSRFEKWGPNPDYARVLEDVQLAEGSIARIDEQIALAAGKVAECDAAVQREASLARALYTALRNGASSVMIVVLALVAGCDGGASADRLQRNRQLDRWVNQSAKEELPIIRVLAISPQLPPAEKAIATEQLETEIVWLAGKAPVGSVVVIVDALECAPVARLEAVAGVPRIRKKALAKALRPIRGFLNQPAARTSVGPIHLPRLAQTAKQWDLPPGSHVVVFGNPLFLKDGKDNFFSMADGRVPSDGCLFEDPKLNLYSTVGRERALPGQYWHLGWSDDAVFEDDSHRQAVLRFWFLYFQAQSATLVTAQPSFFAAADAARENATEPLMQADANPDARPAMVRIVKIQHEDEVKLEPKKSRTSDPQADSPEARKRMDGDGRKQRDASAPPQVARPPKASGEVKPQTSAAQSPKRIETPKVAASPRSASPSRDKHPSRETAELPTKAVDGETKASNNNQRHEVDQHGNVQGSDHDLISDGQMRGQRIVLATFYQHGEVDTSPLATALTTKGFTVERLHGPLPPLSEFNSLLDESQQFWMWSSAHPSQLPASHLQTIVQRWRAGKLALCLLADNTPYTAEASTVLSAIARGSSIHGNYPGEQTLRARSGNGPGFDPRVPLFHNITTLYEGTTISSMSGPGLVPVCYASNGSPLIATLQREGSSRLVVHGGFTSFYKRYWDDAGVSRFAVNCAGWLAGGDDIAE